MAGLWRRRDLLNGLAGLALLPVLGQAASHRPAPLFAVAWQRVAGSVQDELLAAAIAALDLRSPVEVRTWTLRRPSGHTTRAVVNGRCGRRLVWWLSDEPEFQICGRPCGLRLQCGCNEWLDATNTQPVEPDARCRHLLERIELKAPWLAAGSATDAG